jgi:hypothetical protein
MPRNGSGTMSVPTTFVANTPILSADVNGNFTDVASALTASLALDGQSTMTGQLKAADGSITAPGIAFGADLNTGLYRSASGTIRATCDGTNTLTLTATGATITGTLTVSGTISGVFASGTKMLFQQTAAPTGWTKDTTHNNKALRVVSGTASSGGTVAFTTAFASQSVAGTVGATALTQAQLPAITLTTNLEYDSSIAGGGARSAYVRGSGSPSDNKASSTLGSGATHTHTFTGTAIDLAVQYVDLIIATKD